MRLLACLIVAPQRGYDEPATLSYAISSFCPTSADGLHLRDKRNQQVLGWLGGGLVVAATGLWAAFVYFFPPVKSPEAKSPEPLPSSVQANCGGIAIGRDV